MTEQEIVNILKENKAKGVAYLFLPKDVWDWIGENFNNPKLLYLAPNGKWESYSETDFDDFDNIVFALPEYYEAKKESKGEWVEFKVRDDGYFNSDIGLYLWFDWQKFLKFSYNQDIGFTAFGGWQYDDSKRWYLSPAVKLHSDLWNSYVIEESEDATPVIPKKIRFWRGNKRE